MMHRLKQTLTRLELYQNQISDQGAQHLLDALKHNSVIPSLLDLSHKSFIIHSVTQTVTSLDLHQNQIGNQGAQHLAAALKNNRVIPSLLDFSKKFYNSSAKSDTCKPQSQPKSNRR